VTLRPAFLTGLALGCLPDRLDGPDALAAYRRYRRAAGAGRLAIDIHRAGTTQGHAAAVLGAGEIGNIAQGPEQWHIVGHIQLMVLAIEIEASHGLATLY